MNYLRKDLSIPLIDIRSRSLTTTIRMYVRPFSICDTISSEVRRQNTRVAIPKWVYYGDMGITIK